MNQLTPLLGLLGLGVGCGLVVIARTWRLPPTPPRLKRYRRPHAGRWLALSTGAGLLAGAVTGWIAGGLLAALGTWTLPQLLGPDRSLRERTARVEGVAGWAEMLRDTLAAAAGLEQTILATAPAAPRAVRPHTIELAACLEHGERLTVALRRLADDLDDPTADLVIAALTLSAQHQARQLASLLSELAETARAQVEMHHRIEASRARIATTQRVVVTTTLAFTAVLIVFNPQFLTPYDTATGQLVLLAIGALFTIAFTWLRRMARITAPERIFAGAGLDEEVSL